MTTALSAIAQTVVIDALRKIEVVHPGGKVPSEQMTIILRMLNYLLKFWEARGVKLHTICDIEVPQYGNKQSYILDSTNLITGWINVNYDTFTKTGGNITSAIYSTSGTQTAITNSIPLIIGRLYKIVATWTNVAGQAPTLTGTGGVPTTLLVSGINNIYFVATGITCVITITNTAAASWGCTFQMPRGDVDISRPMRVISARRRDNSTLYETPLLVISREEYKQLAIKSSISPVSQVAYEKQQDYGLLYVYPVSDALYTSPEYTVILTIQRSLNIFDDTSTAADLPPEMYLALVYGLADLLADDYSQPSNRRNDIANKALNYFNQLIMTDQENTSIFIQPRIK